MNHDFISRKQVKKHIYGQGHNNVDIVGFFSHV